MVKTYVKSPRPSRPAIRSRPIKQTILEVDEEGLPYLSPYASVPQRKVGRELNRRKLVWRAEVNYFGGRSGVDKSGAAQVVDFELFGEHAGKILRIQGEYWHRRPGAEARDDVQAMYLRALGKTPIDIWEGEINLDVQAAVADALGLAQ